MTAKKRMGNLSLSSFGGVSRSSAPEEATVAAPPPEGPQPTTSSQVAPPTDEPKPSTKPKTKRRRKETLTTVNIKIERKQQRWLQDTAQQVRDNNEYAVPPNERVYPQHLIGAAIDLLRAQDLDWEAIHNIEELKSALNL